MSVYYPRDPFPKQEIAHAILAKKDAGVTLQPCARQKARRKAPGKRNPLAEERDAPTGSDQFNVKS
jgi:hypothetical protein